MRKIILLGAAPIDGKLRYPSEGTLSVSPETADELIKIGLAKGDDLDSMKRDEVMDEALAIGANVGPGATKPEIVDAVRARRENKA